MFKKIEILNQLSPKETSTLWINNQLINNVAPPDTDGIIKFYSGQQEFSYLGTLQQFKTDLGL